MIQLAGWAPRRAFAQVTTLAGPLTAVNTADKPDAVIPDASEWEHAIKDGRTSYTFPPFSFTVLRLE